MKFPVRIAAATVTALSASSAAAFSVGYTRRVALAQAASATSFLQTPFTRTLSSLAMTASPEEFAKSEIESNKVVVFSKTYCPFCHATKALFEEMDVDAKVIELDVVENGNQIQEALLDMSGQRTVPNVFINGKHLGGNDATQAAAKSGKLQEMLN